MELTGALELGFGFACAPISVVAMQSRCSGRPVRHQAVYFRTREAGRERQSRQVGEPWGTAEPLGTSPGPTLEVEKVLH